MRKHPEFESLPLRFLISTWCYLFWQIALYVRRSTQVGRRGAPAKGVGRVTGARVQISPSPPTQKHTIWCAFCVAENVTTDLNSSDGGATYDIIYRKPHIMPIDNTKKVWYPFPHGALAQLGARYAQSWTPPHNFINKNLTNPNMGV